ncbi:MAG: M18 family aminopeptidase [Emergencia sp.]
MFENIAADLLAFLKASPTCFHAADSLGKRLSDSGFVRLEENKKWNLTPGGRYFVTRGDAALAAFVLPEGPAGAFRITACHGDSPALKIKADPEMECGHYIRLNVERYGGMIHSTWFDRPLSAAGRVIVKSESGLVSKLVDIDRDLLMIPSPAPHLFPDINKGYVCDPQKDLLPILGSLNTKGSFLQLVADAAGVSPDEILDYDLFLYSRQPASVWGAQEEFISAGRLDDLQCAFSTFEGFLCAADERSPDSSHVSVYCLFDNEETGSISRQGAGSTFLKDTMERISENLHMSREDYLIALSDSFMISADNAHAVHPAHMDRSDPVNRPYINEGIVIKYNAQQTYCTDGYSAAVFRELCSRADVPCQVFTNNSNVRGGSTLGNISGTQVAVRTVDVGLPQLAMHSVCETAGVKDTEYLARVCREFMKRR